MRRLCRQRPARDAPRTPASSRCLHRRLGPAPRRAAIRPRFANAAGPPRHGRGGPGGVCGDLEVGGGDPRCPPREAPVGVSRLHPHRRHAGGRCDLGPRPLHARMHRGASPPRGHLPGGLPEGRRAGPRGAAAPGVRRDPAFPRTEVRVQPDRGRGPGPRAESGARPASSGGGLYPGQCDRRHRNTARSRGPGARVQGRLPRHRARVGRARALLRGRGLPGGSGARRSRGDLRAGRGPDAQGGGAPLQGGPGCTTGPARGPAHRPRSTTSHSTGRASSRSR